MVFTEENEYCSMNQISEEDFKQKIINIKEELTREKLVSLNFSEKFIDSQDNFYWNKFNMFSSLVTKGCKQPQGCFLDLGGNGEWSNIFDSFFSLCPPKERFLRT